MMKIKGANMKDLMKINVYDFKDSLVIVGSCLMRMHPKAYKQLQKLDENIYDLCLENTHINMAITKIAGVLSRNKISKLIFASVDKSPHCVQLHYIENELRKMINLDSTIIEHYVAVDDDLKLIDIKTIKLSKSLYDLQNLINK